MTRPNWRDQLDRDGYYVVPNVIPQEACDEFCSEAWNWLESFPYGFKRDDKTTWTAEHMPYGFTGGLFNRYAVNHEAFVWKIRVVPDIQEVFAQYWGTSDLIASFDGINVTLPINKEHGRTDVKPTSAWPHIDQNPHQIDHVQLMQGIANLSPNGPDDGGLVVVRGSHDLHQEYFDAHGSVDPAREGELGYDYRVEDMDWFVERGCEVVKVCAGAGDLILWDSRIVHWNQSPVGKQTRFVAYVAYTPRRLMSQVELDEKLQIFLDGKGTSGWPHKNIVPTEVVEEDQRRPTRPDGTVDLADRVKPLKEAAHTPEVMFAVGVRS